MQPSSTSVSTQLAVRRLHIGGRVPAPGWEIMDANPGPHVDHLGNAADLSRFPDHSFAAVYASHVLEHFDYRHELVQTLREWRRVLVPGGRLHVSVPDLDTLCQLMVDRQNLSINERFMVMRMMFGGHVDRWDYHVCGLNAEFLSAFLNEAGFRDPVRVGSFGLFKDTSELAFKGVRISLNVIAEA